MKIQDLGQLEGRLLVYGGPYSNLSATEALIAQASALGVSAGRCICTGDVVAYAAHPAETVAAVRAFGGPVVAGNCERQIAERAQDCGCGFEDGTACDLLSRGWYPFASAAVAKDDRAWMGALPDVAVFTHGGRRCAVIHGGVRNISRFIWPSSPEAVFAEEVAALTEAIGPVDVIFAGHSGIAFQRHVAGVRWVNAGVIGMPPHDGRVETRFAVVDEAGEVVFHRLSYDPAPEVAAMQAAGLTQGYDRSLMSGIWPSEDVLPPEMQR